MTNYLKEAINVKKTPQSQPIPGSQQVKNSAGGYSFAVDDWTRLERFLILGSEGGSYYAAERELTTDNIDSVRRCIWQDGPRVVATLVEISDSGRAPKNDPALFVLAMCASAKDEITRIAALNVLPEVARTGTHLFHFAEYIDKMRGWGPALRKAVQGWYLDKPVEKLVYQLVKYQQRDGWSHRDLLRLSHPKTFQSDRNFAFAWAVGKAGAEIAEREVLQHDDLFCIDAYEQAKHADEATTIRLIHDYGLTREMIATEHQKSIKVWEALLQNMPMTAMIRSLGRMGSVGLLTPMSLEAQNVCDRLRDAEVLRKARVHPIQVLIALKTYEQGCGQRGSLHWPVVPQVLKALDDAFHLSFQTIEPTGKRWLLGIDVSSSMTWGTVAGTAGLRPNVAAAAMAMVTARTEEWYMPMGFASSFRKLPITAQDNLTDVMRKTSNIGFGGTDCALPMLYALKKQIPVDVFAVYTDSETWYGSIHPVQALRRYREKMGVAAKLIVVSMCANKFSIADPDDRGMLDVVGFDAAAPAVMADFARA